MSVQSGRKMGHGFIQGMLHGLDDDRHARFSLPVLSILLTLVAASVLLLALGRNPMTAMTAFLRGSGLLPKPNYAGGQSMLSDFLSFLGILAPMLLAALGVIVAMKAGMFNIGIAGQMLAAGFVATATVGYSSLGAYVARPLVILVGIATGGVLGAAIGYLKHRFNIHEVVSSIMFNYIISYVTGFAINTYYVDAVSRSSRIGSSASRLSITGITVGGARLTLPIGIVLAIVGAFFLLFLLDRTVVGFEMKAVGLSKDCAQYAGVDVGRSIVLAMGLSGMFGGLAGVTYYMGYFNTIIPKELATLGYDSIAVALLGNVSPVGAVFSSVLITIFQRGSVYMSSTVGVPREIASVITGILLLFSACGIYMRHLAKKAMQQSAETGAAGHEAGAAGHEVGVARDETDWSGGG